jgi:hypothetical protein
VVYALARTGGNQRLYTFYSAFGFIGEKLKACQCNCQGSGKRKIRIQVLSASLGFYRG